MLVLSVSSIIAPKSIKCQTEHQTQFTVISVTQFDIYLSDRLELAGWSF